MKPKPSNEKLTGDLKSMFSESAVARALGKPTVTGDELLWVDVDSIDDNPFQPRLNYPNDEQLEMVLDFNRDGQLQAGLARRHPTKQGRYELASAHRRKYAVKNGAYFTDPDSGEETRIYGNAGSQQTDPRAFEGKMQIVVRAQISDAEMRRYGYKENKSRLDLNPMEKAKYYNDTRDYLTEKGRYEGTIAPEREAGWRAVGEFLGESFRPIHRIARLMELPPPMRRAIEEGVLNERHGRALMELAEWEKEQRLLFVDIKKNGWSGTHAEKIAVERKKVLNEKIPTPDSLIDEAVEQELDRREQPAAQKKAEEDAAQNKRRGITLAGNGAPSSSPNVPQAASAPATRPPVSNAATARERHLRDALNSLSDAVVSLQLAGGNWSKSWSEGLLGLCDEITDEADAEGESD